MNFTYLLILFFVVSGTNSTKQLNLVEVKTFETEMHKAETTTGRIQVKIEEGIHIQADKVNDLYLVPTLFSIEENNEFKLIDVKYPESKSLKLEGSDMKLDVFEGTFYIFFRILADRDIKSGDHLLNGSLYFQACDSKSCFAPETIRFDIPVVKN